MPWNERGVVTRTNLFARSIGGAVGAAIFGAIANSIFGAGDAASLSPATIEAVQRSGLPRRGNCGGGKCRGRFRDTEAARGVRGGGGYRAGGCTGLARPTPGRDGASNSH